MAVNRGGYKGERRPARPLDQARLEELALAYVARFATSGGKLEAYLRRKLRERGWEGEGEPDLKHLVQSYAERGYIDDAGYARAKTSDLLRRGYGQRRVHQALGQAGIASDIKESVIPGEAAARRAVLALASRRGFGPFGAAQPDRPAREKQIAAVLRAGHTLENARAMIDASDEEAAREWVTEAEEDGGYVLD